MSKSVRPERETRLVELCYSHAAKLVVAEFERREEARGVSSIYVRDAVTNEYRRLVPPDDAISYRNLVPVRSEPIVYFNVMKIAADGGGRWLRIARVNVLTHEVEEILQQPELESLTNYDPHLRVKPWVSDLSSVSDDGVKLTCRIGVPEPRPGGAVHMSYPFFDFDVRDRTMTLLTALETSLL